LTRRDNLKAGLFDAPRQRRKYPLQRINPQSIFTRSRPPDLFILIVAPPIQIVAPHKLFIEYEAVAGGSGYVAPSVMLEFGARSTGEPASVRDISCDAAGLVDGIESPTAKGRAALEQTTPGCWKTVFFSIRWRPSKSSSHDAQIQGKANVSG